MRLDTIKRLFWSTALVGQLAWPVMAATGDAETGTSSGALEEVVVTATRRSERLQDVPVSVIAFSQEKLDATGCFTCCWPVALGSHRYLDNTFNREWACAQVFIG
jgi:hypothetical protein